MLRFYFYLLLGAVLIGVPSGCGSNSPQEIKTSSDKPLADYQSQLLDLAFETATLIPLKPHIKDRARAQEAVIHAALELDQPQRALGYTEKIPNWRKGACLADLAFYCAQNGFEDEAKGYLERAAEIYETTEDWRKDRIKVKMARAHVLMGQSAKADELKAGVVESETGKVEGVKASQSDEADFERQMKVLDEMIAKQHLDILKNALNSYAELFSRFYENEERRSLIEEKIKIGWEKLPIFLRIELLRNLAGYALEHGDKDKALELVNEAQQYIDDYQWPAEHYVPMLAKMALMRFRAGDEEKALADAEAALEHFEANKKLIINIYRAEALYPLAAAYKAMGETEKALAVYKKALEEGNINPNSRPRAEDLSATCYSMAVEAVEPDEELWTHIKKTKEGLRPPW